MGELCTYIHLLDLMTDENRISSGTFVALVAVPLIHMGEVGDVGRRSGILFTITSISALCGPPISGAIAQRTGSYEAVGYYAGMAQIFACTFLKQAFRKLRSPLCNFNVDSPIPTDGSNYKREMLTSV